MAGPIDSLDTIFKLLKQMEATLLSLKRLRNYLVTADARELLDVMIEEVQACLSAVKRTIVQ